MQDLKDNHGLDEEPLEIFLDRVCIDSLKEKYGVGATSTPIPHLKARHNVRQTAGIDAHFLDFNEIVKLAGITIS